MKEKYRVVCSENQEKYPDKVFIDFLPANPEKQEICLTHSQMLMLRNKLNPGLQEVGEGMLLIDKGNNGLEIEYLKASSKETKILQEKFKHRYEKLIFKAFREMKAAGKNQTLNPTLRDLPYLYGLNQNQDLETPKSFREYELREKQREQGCNEQRRKAMLNRPPKPLLAWLWARDK